MKRYFASLWIVLVFLGFNVPAFAGPSASFSVNVVPAVVGPPPVWAVTHQDGCQLVSGTTTDFSCQMRWRDSFVNDSMVFDIAWRLGGTGTAPPITAVTFKNSAATCAFIPGTYASDTTDSVAISKYLCSNLTRPASAFDITFASAAQLVVVRTTELYGCSNPCVAEVGNAAVTPSANVSMSITTAGPTSSPNELIQSFAYGPFSSFSAPSETVISNASSGASSFLTQYQIGTAAGVYANSFTNSNAHNNVLQNIVAFQQNPSPPLSPPSVVGQQIFTVFDNQKAGSAVQGGVFAYTADYSPVLVKPSLTTNPGGLLVLNAAGNGFTLAQALTSANDGTYSGQLSVTQNGVTVNQPISLIVEPPRTYADATNCPVIPPPAAQRAGYTKLVNCLEPTSAFYQTLSNWINCTDGINPPGFQWNSDWPAITCRDISFPTDANGRKVMEFHWHSTDDINTMRAANSTASIIKIKGVTDTNQGTTALVQAPISHSYWEWRGSTGPMLTDSIAVAPPFDLFQWANCPAGVVNCSDQTKPEWSLIEVDDIEVYGPRPNGGASSIHFWDDVSFGYSANNVSPATQGQIAATIPGWLATQTHSYGTMLTGDNTAGLRISSFVDDQLIPSTPSTIGRAAAGGSLNPYDLGLLPIWDYFGHDNLTTTNKQYNYWIAWFGGTYGLNTANCQASPACVAEGGQPDQITDSEYIAVWSCPEYATDPTCAATTKGLAQ